MFLMKAIVVVAEFMHEYMEQHKGSRLRFGEPAQERSLHAVKTKADPLKDVRVSFKICRRQFRPKVFMPSVEENRPSLLAMIERISCVARVMAGQNNTLQIL